MVAAFRRVRGTESLDPDYFYAREGPTRPLRWPQIALIFLKSNGRNAITRFPTFAEVIITTYINVCVTTVIKLYTLLDYQILLLIPYYKISLTYLYELDTVNNGQRQESLPFPSMLVICLLKRQKQLLIKFVSKSSFYYRAHEVKGSLVFPLFKVLSVPGFGLKHFIIVIARLTRDCLR